MMRTRPPFALAALWIVGSLLPALAPSPARAAEDQPVIKDHPATAARAADEDRAWVEAMKKVHARFTGRRGTFAQFGDSITVTMAFWAPLRYEHKGASLGPEGRAAFEEVAGYMLPECWDQWKGNAFGSEGGMTIRWAHENVDRWLAKLNPEVALLMFGTNDLNQVSIEEYEKKLREVIDKCLTRGTIVLLSTIPPRGGQFEKSARFAAVGRKVARDMKVPLVDYFQAILTRRPDDWDGSAAKYKTADAKADARDPYNVPTLLSRDGVHPSYPKQYQGDYSPEGLKNNGYGLRNYITLLGYAQVIRAVLK